MPTLHLLMSSILPLPSAVFDSSYCSDGLVGAEFPKVVSVRSRSLSMQETLEDSCGLQSAIVLSVSQRARKVRIGRDDGALAP